MDLTGGGIPRFSGRKKAAFLFFLTWAWLAGIAGFAQVQHLDSGWHHLRNTGSREWSSFPSNAEARKLTLHFRSPGQAAEHSLAIRQCDVKLTWTVSLNGRRLGTLVPDEKDLVSFFRIPSQALADANVLEIACDAPQADDIRVGEIVLHNRSLDSVLSDGRLELEVRDAESGALVPARITVTNGMGTLQSMAAPPEGPVSVRPGFAYTGNGHLSAGLPEGSYTVYAGRGFEYGVDSAAIVIRRGERVSRTLSIAREVSTAGWISSDTHIHTLTWSGHGDATAEERVLTIAGEGIELPVITEHNLQADFRNTARNQHVDAYFTPVTGNEVTTAVGHFNVFPLAADQGVFDHRAASWRALSEDLREARNSKVIILNHARDIHAGFRPFDPRLHLSSAGVRLDGAVFPANAMEVINSGAQQTDRMELTRDWFGMLNHGHIITPAGSSDSHDVARYIVGQARTYIRCGDDNAAEIDVPQAVRNFREGNVMVSFGLLAEIEVNDVYGPGELVPAADAFKVSVRVSGPAWTKAERVSLYANGNKIREAEITDPYGAGLKWSGSWTLTLPAHDIFLVALAEGPDPHAPFWPIAKPYQPTTPHWAGGIFGLSGAVWVDADKNGQRTAAIDYARALYEQASGDIASLVESLASYDESVAVQAAALLHVNGKPLADAGVSKALRSATPATRAGFDTVLRELKRAQP